MKSWMLPLRIVDGRQLIEFAWEEQLLESVGTPIKQEDFEWLLLLAIVVFL